MTHYNNLDIDAVLGAFVEVLEPLRLLNSEVSVLPDDWSVSGRPQGRNRVLVGFAGLSLTPPAKTVAGRQTTQSAQLTVEVIVQAVSLRGDRGALGLIQTCLSLLVGRRLAERTGLVYSTGFGYVNHDNRIWTYSGQFVCEYAHASDPEIGLLPPLL